VHTFTVVQMTPDMASVKPTKDALFAILGRSTAASVRQTVFSRLYQSHILLLYTVQSHGTLVTLVLLFRSIDADMKCANSASILLSRTLLVR